MVSLTKKEQDSLNKKISLISDKNKENIALSKEIKSSHQKYTNIIKQLENIKQQAISLTKEFGTQKRQVETKLNQAESFYTNKFIPLKYKIEDKAKGLNNTLTESTLFLKEITKKRDQLAKTNTLYQLHIKEINGILSKAKIIEKSASSANDSIIKHKENANKLLRDAKVILSSIKDHQTKVSTLNSETNKILINSQEALNKIHDIKLSASKSNENIHEIEQEAMLTNDKITKLYEIVTNKSMAGAFDVRRKALIEDLSGWDKKVKNWSLYLFLAVVFLLFIQLSFNQWTLKGLGYDFYLRFLFAGPVLYYLIFCNTQYNHIRRSLDKYTFKTSIALSIEAHTELLSKNFFDKSCNDKIMNFSLESLNKIYDKPYYDELAMVKAKSNNSQSGDEHKIIESLLLSKNSEFVKAFNSAIQLIKGKSVT